MRCFQRTIDNNQPICIAWCLSLDMVNDIKSTLLKGTHTNEDKDILSQNLLEKSAQYPAKALIDTGATSSCISNNLAQKLKLNPIAKSEMKTASGECKTNVYEVILLIPKHEVKLKEGKVTSANLVDITEFHVKAMEIAENLAFDVIIGMDIIQRGSLYISNDIYSLCI